MAAAIAVDSFLVGPSELYVPPPQQPPTPAVTNSVPDPFMDIMMSDFNSATAPRNPPAMGFTDNESATYLSSGNPCLDFFFKIVPSSSADSLNKGLKLAYDHDALTALKLVCNLRGVRGYGKNDKEGFYNAALWLHKNHPKTLACNVGTFAEFGYFKDLLEILFRLVEGEYVRKNRKAEHERRKALKLKKMKELGKRRRVRRTPSAQPNGGDASGKATKKNPKKRVDSERRALIERRRVEIEMKEAKKKRTEKRAAMAQNAVLNYTRDPDYKYLHDRVSDYFADCLKADSKFFKDGEFKKISFAAKWCPSLDSAYDRALLICEPIAKKVFPRESYPEYDGVEEAHYAYRVRDRLRKEVLVPLRRGLRLPEVYAGAQDWASLRYSRVASVAMKTYRGKFRKHKKSKGKAGNDKMEVSTEDDKSNVKAGEDKMEVSTEDGKSKVKARKAKVTAGALLPHEIIKSLDDYDAGELAELQWKCMVDDLAKKGKFKNCLAVCDVSGSMEGTPKEVALALGVLVSELCEEPWRGKLMTFSEKPNLQLVQGDDLRSKVEFVRGLEPGKNSDLQKVFDLILEVAVRGKLSEEQMIKRVFVFTDMEFDDASGKKQNIQEHSRRRASYSGNSNSTSEARFSTTDYQTMVNKFTERGYGSAVPKIVLWNLRDSEATPVPGNEPGVALVSGFSKNLITLFLEDDLDLSPESVMEAVISGEEYKDLVVID